jgi:cellulose synthase/poly-beta-1,6-N-acetylglucosamine synthase-like glycosyltransferase
MSFTINLFLDINIAIKSNYTVPFPYIYTIIHNLTPIFLKIGKIVATFSIWIILVKLQVNMHDVSWKHKMICGQE